MYFKTWKKVRRTTWILFAFLKSLRRTLIKYQTSL